jgi:hypothetical protein
MVQRWMVMLLLLCASCADWEDRADERTARCQAHGVVLGMAICGNSPPEERTACASSASAMVTVECLRNYPHRDAWD